MPFSLTCEETEEVLARALGDIIVADEQELRDIAEYLLGAIKTESDRVARLLEHVVPAGALVPHAPGAGDDRDGAPAVPGDAAAAALAPEGQLPDQRAQRPRKKGRSGASNWKKFNEKRSKQKEEKKARQAQRSTKRRVVGKQSPIQLG